MRSDRLIFLFFFVLLFAVIGIAFAGPTELVSVADDGTQADGPSFTASISKDGRFVAFDSTAGNLVPDDDGFFSDVFVFDRLNDTIERVSLSAFSLNADGDSINPSISADGRFVAFASDADDLVFIDDNNARDIFVFDRQTQNMQMVSIAAFGFAPNGDSDFPVISNDGRFVAFVSDADDIIFGDFNFSQDIFLADVSTSGITLVTLNANLEQADANSFFPAISGNGRFVAFSSDADNLVTNDTNFRRDIFVFDRNTGNLTRVSLSSGGVQANGSSDFASLNADGSVIAFASLATNLVTGDTNLRQDIFVRNLTAGVTTRESVSTGGAQSNDDSSVPVLSANGRFVAFVSLADNLVSNDNNFSQDIFARDRVTHLTVLASVSDLGEQANDDSFLPSITADGRDIAFTSLADSLVLADKNFVSDAFVRRWITFPDVPPEFNAFREIEALVTAQITFGFPDGFYHPEAFVRRDQMAIFIARAIVGGEEFVPAGPDTPTFTDIPKTDPAFRHIEFLARLNIVQGFFDNTFRPALEVNRAQMAVFIAREVAGGDANVPPGPTEPTFADVPVDFWAFKYIEFLAGLDIVHGLPDGLYHPENLVNRGQMALFIARAFNLPLPGA